MILRSMWSKISSLTYVMFRDLTAVVWKVRLTSFISERDKFCFLIQLHFSFKLTKELLES